MTPPPSAAPIVRHGWAGFGWQLTTAFYSRREDLASVPYRNSGFGHSAITVEQTSPGDLRAWRAGMMVGARAAVQVFTGTAKKRG